MILINKTYLSKLNVFYLKSVQSNSFILFFESNFKIILILKFSKIKWKKNNIRIPY